MEIKYSNQVPQIYFTLKKRFGVRWDKGVTITYGDTVYAKDPLPVDLQVHEAVHVKQQLAMGKDKWWEQFLKDKDFRAAQETEAYAAQWQWIVANCSEDYQRSMYQHLTTSMVKRYGGAFTEEDVAHILA